MLAFRVFPWEFAASLCLSTLSNVGRIRCAPCRLPGRPSEEEHGQTCNFGAVCFRAFPRVAASLLCVHTLHPVVWCLLLAGVDPAAVGTGDAPPFPGWHIRPAVAPVILIAKPAADSSWNIGDGDVVPDAAEDTVALGGGADMAGAAGAGPVACVRLRPFLESVWVSVLCVCIRLLPGCVNAQITHTPRAGGETQVQNLQRRSFLEDSWGVVITTPICS